MVTLSMVLYGILFVGVLGLLYMFFSVRWIVKQRGETPEMKLIAKRIAEGAVSFLRTEYLYIALFVAVTAGLLSFIDLGDRNANGLRILNYVVGAALSGVAGAIGLRIATMANVKTAQAARTSLRRSFKLSFVGGSIMGVGVITFALLGMLLLFWGMLRWFIGPNYLSTDFFELDKVKLLLEVLTGFALGAETIALFARVAGGIYTKAADVGADIVGKVEMGIPEDDLRNPATIADNVGDNVGDVAGMGADLFGSYVSTLLAAMVLGTHVSVCADFSFAPVILPLAIGSLGMVACLLSTFFVGLRNEKSKVQQALNIGNILSIVLTGIGAYFLLQYMFPDSFTMGRSFKRSALYYTVLIGLSVGFLVSWITEYFTSMHYAPVKFIIRQSVTGPATNLITGLGVGMISTMLPVLIFAIAIYLSYALAGFFGVSIAAVSMMATTPSNLTMDAFGPIADNAGGIAEMSKLPDVVRERTDALDAAGNTTAAAGKGFAIASATLTSLGLFVAFSKATGVETVNLYDASVLSGLLLGAIVPFIFSALTIMAVGSAAMKMVEEVRRQFREIPGLLQGTATPDYDRCITIATRAALQKMFVPALLALVPPVLIGFYLGVQVLAAFLVSVVVVGTVMSLFQSNAGGAWDNAKKAFEQEIMINGEIMGKGSPAHEASVVGDTVGDPLKDTSGPAINILIKLSIIVALIVSSLI